MNKIISSSDIEFILNEIDKFKNNQCIVAIDGRCAAGKTTLAGQLQDILQCSVIHMDDFFLRPEQRTEKRLNEPGGNIDYERFGKEVILPLRNKQEFIYYPFDCHKFAFGEKIFVKQTRVMIIEGAYACHPEFADIYSLKIFFDIDQNEQLIRIERRNGKEQLTQFINKWIPLEEKYFDEFQIMNTCDIILK